MDPSLLSDAALRPFAPLVLAAWQDGWLTPSELLELRDLLQHATWLDDGQRRDLGAWLNPEAPPSPQALRELQRQVSGWLAERPPGERRSLERFCSALVEGDLSAEVREDAFTMLSSAQSLLEPVDFQRGGWLPGSRPSASPRRASAPWVPEVRAALEGPEVATRDRIRALLEGGDFRAPRDLDTAGYRQQVRTWLERLVQEGIVAHCYPDGPTGSRHLGRFAAVFETLAMFDLNLVVKFGVQAGLFVGAIEQLGNESHRGPMAEALRGELYGCFAMTERAHGSNVRGLETRATYLPDEQQFEIETPSAGAGKEWIGNAAEDGRMAVVFAQLHTLGEAYGVHVFMVPIRDERGEPMPGVRIEDCGRKMGLNGVDNGRLWFDRVRVPREALLDRFGQVAPDGEYSSPIPSSGKRFFSMLSTLVGGRVAVGGGANAAAKVGLAIAVHYGARRRQFEDGEGCERPVLDYLTHRLRLMPNLASAYAYTFAQQELVELLQVPEGDDPPEGLEGHDVETLAAGVKSLATWHATDALQACRECCGGQGYLSENRIDALRTDVDVFTTFEGDNTVLLSLVANNLLRKLRKDLRKRPVRSVVSSIAEDVTSAVTDRSPWSRRDGSDEGMRDVELIASALRFREKSLLSSLARRVTKRLRNDVPAQDAFAECQDHAVALGRAYVESFTFDAFRRAAERTPALSPMCILFGLRCIQRDLGWFFEKDFVAAPRAQALRRVVRALCVELSDDALAWVDALGVPRPCLGPLADDAYLVASGLATAEACGEAVRDAEAKS